MTQGRQVSGPSVIPIYCRLLHWGKGFHCKYVSVSPTLLHIVHLSLVEAVQSTLSSYLEGITAYVSMDSLCQWEEVSLDPF